MVLALLVGAVATAVFAALLGPTTGEEFFLAWGFLFLIYCLLGFTGAALS